MLDKFEDIFATVPGLIIESLEVVVDTNDRIRQVIQIFPSRHVALNQGFFDVACTTANKARSAP